MINQNDQAHVEVVAVLADILEEIKRPINQSNSVSDLLEHLTVRYPDYFDNHLTGKTQADIDQLLEEDEG